MNKTVPPEETPETPVKRKVGRARKVVVVIEPEKKLLGWGSLVSEFLEDKNFDQNLTALIYKYTGNPPEGKVWNRGLGWVCENLSIEVIKTNYPLILEKTCSLPSAQREWIKYLVNEAIRKTIEYYEKIK